MVSVPAIDLRDISYSYQQRAALKSVSLAVQPREIFVFLGPNGGGKTTLFRLLTTLIPCQQGEASILGFDLRSQARQIRERIGVVFQAPSLDKKLTVRENLRHQAALYGVRGNLLAEREAELLEQLGLADRANDRTETLSGGLRRRVELAKGLMHHPSLVLLDEPSTGLDPGARADLWQYLMRLREESGVTVVLTTHLLEEAERADRIAILNEGTLVALDTPDALRASVGADTLMIQTRDPQRLAEAIRQQFQIDASIVDGQVRLEVDDGPPWVPKLFQTFASELEAVTLGKPTLDDVFIAKTGHRFWQARSESNAETAGSRRRSQTTFAANADGRGGSRG